MECRALFLSVFAVLFLSVICALPAEPEENGDIDVSKTFLCGLSKPVAAQKETFGRFKRSYQPTKKWTKRHLTYFFANWTSQLTKEDTRSEFRKALVPWEKHSEFKFQEVFSSDADITVAFAREAYGHKLDGPGLTLSLSSAPEEDRPAFVFFDIDEKWEVNPKNNKSVDFFSVAVHNVGHTLGLFNSENEESVMSPYYKKLNSSSFDLSNDDITALLALYGNKEERQILTNVIPKEE